VTDPRSFAWAMLLFAAVCVAALLSNRVTVRIPVPAPALMLIAAAVAVNVVPNLDRPPERLVERLVTVALLCILFDGGMHIGWTRFRDAVAPITVVGVGGTFLTVAGGALVLHTLGLTWYAAVLVATALAPTDPAVVFSVLGHREVSGRSGTILEGESGANDPVGIALMASLISAGDLGGGAFLHVATEFLLQMGVGAAVGLLGGRALVYLMRVALPSEGLYPLRTLASAAALFGVATLAHGSGFLAVFIAGIVIGDARAPYKREIEHFHSALASLAEIIAFVVLGLTVDLPVLAHRDVWVPAAVLVAALVIVIRPALVGLCLARSGLRPNEKTFVLFAGLKGAVPMLLGSLLLNAHVDDAERLYGIVVLVVTFSVIVQGSLVPSLARWLRVPMRTLEPEPWSLGVRLRDEPNGVHRLVITPGSAADGRTIAQLTELPEGAWISFVVRAGHLVPVNADTALRADDEALVLAEPDLADDLRRIFQQPRPTTGDGA